MLASSRAAAVGFWPTPFTMTKNRASGVLPGTVKSVPPSRAIFTSTWVDELATRAQDA